jgi:hypothetical protein
MMKQRLCFQRFSNENLSVGAPEAQRSRSSLRRITAGKEAEDRAAATAHRGSYRTAFLK